MRVGAVEDALGQLHQLAVSARAIGPPASAVCPLHGAASDGRHLHAFGTAGGSVVVQSLPTGGPATSVPETLAIVDTCDGGTCCDGSTARSVSKRQAVHHVAWDGKQVLAVAAGAQLQLLSLDGLLSRLQLSSTWPVRLSCSFALDLHVLTNPSLCNVCLRVMCSRYVIVRTAPSSPGQHTRTASASIVCTRKADPYGNKQQQMP